MKCLRRIITVFLTTVALLLLTIACVKTSPPPKAPGIDEVEDVAEAPPQFAAKVAAIDVIDDRTQTAVPGRKLHMPEWTIVGQADEFAPVLDDAQRDMIRDETRSHFVPGERTVTIEIYVLDGRKAFKVGERTESITMTFALRIEISDQADAHDVRIGQGRASFTEESLDITYEQAAELYARAIRESIRIAFERIGADRLPGSR